MKKEKYVVLCNEGIKENKGCYYYYRKFNKEDYLAFIEKNKDNDIRLFVDNSLCDDRMDNLDKRARMVKYNELIFEAMIDVRDWLSILKGSQILGSEDMYSKISNAVSRVRNPLKDKNK